MILFLNKKYLGYFYVYTHPLKILALSQIKSLLN